MCDGRLDCASGEDEEHCVKDFPDKPGVAGESRDRRAGTAGELGSVVASDHVCQFLVLLEKVPGAGSWHVYL